MTKQHPLCLSVDRTDEIDGEHSDNVGMHIKSPAFLPCKEWSFGEVSQSSNCHALLFFFLIDEGGFKKFNILQNVNSTRHHTYIKVRFFDSLSLCRQALCHIMDTEIMQLI